MCKVGGTYCDLELYVVGNVGEGWRRKQDPKTRNPRVALPTFVMFTLIVADNVLRNQVQVEIENLRVPKSAGWSSVPIITGKQNCDKIYDCYGRNIRRMK